MIKSVKKDLSPAMFLIHYSPLSDRFKYLNLLFSGWSLRPNWITEKNYSEFYEQESKDQYASGVLKKYIAMDLLINFKSQTISRRHAYRIAQIKLFLHYFSNGLLFKDTFLLEERKLENAVLEVQRMHITALQQGLNMNTEWILVLEDDAVAQPNAEIRLLEIINNRPAENTWINLNSGALLPRTKSEKVDTLGLFRVKPSATRCTVAYLISRDLAVKFVEDSNEFGVPNYLPIDFYFQVLLRKFKAISYWADPELFLQGSEIGTYDSGLSGFRSA
jgi:hypothetical protein